jgi:radical SAM superfamily enzyme YgiQ (UPF0313 family)
MADMKNQLIDKSRRRLADESGTIFHSWKQDRYRVALVYPNNYSNGMSNLGFQTVYNLINNRDDCLCERFFLPDKEDIDAARQTSSSLLSIESERKLCDFDLIALSISFENDYLNLPDIFDLSGIPLFSEDRNDSHPLVLFGGACAFINPEPLADIVDIVAVGEAEAMLPKLLDSLAQSDFARADCYQQLLTLSGIYLPRFYQPDYSSGSFLGFKRESDAPERVRRLYAVDLDSAPSRNFIKAPDSEFGHMALTEVSRGCSRGCRFCAAGFVYLPPRERTLESLTDQIRVGLVDAERVGLVAAAVADYTDIDALQRWIIEEGAKISISSLRLDALTKEEVGNLKTAELKTVAIAPEAGSQRMRDFINKGINEEQILNAVQMLADGGMQNLKLYFIIGLPTEGQDDIDAVLSLSKTIGEIWRQAGRDRGRMGTVTLSVNPFIPKPFTPLQWAGMDSEKSLKKKYRYLQSSVSRIPNMKINCESIRSARLQAFLSRGDRRIARLLPELSRGKNLKQLCRSFDLDAEAYITAYFEEGDLLPWEVIDQGIDRSYLWKEYQRAYLGKVTQPCAPGCRRCGVCVE